MSSQKIYNSLSFHDQRRKEYFEFVLQEEAQSFASEFNVQACSNNKGSFSVIIPPVTMTGDSQIICCDRKIYCPLFSSYCDRQDRSNYFLLLSSLV